MMDELRKYLESAPGANVSWWSQVCGRLEWVGCDGDGGACGWKERGGEEGN